MVRKHSIAHMAIVFASVGVELCAFGAPQKQSPPNIVKTAMHIGHGAQVASSVVQEKVKPKPKPNHQAVVAAVQPVVVAEPVVVEKPKVIADWTIAAYIQADNNLAPFAVYNINNMQQAALVNSVNMIVQWDQPSNNKTWRYKIVRGGRIEDASLSAEMGLNPGQELVTMMRWAKTNYEARRYATILWNHGDGIIDPRSVRLHPTRGILFDDSQNTYLNNQALTAAFASIKSDVLGKNIDLVGMDACLMAMLEVGYQIKDSVDVLVTSQNTEPGQGWSYSGFLNPLCADSASFTAPMLGREIVKAYGNFYKNNGGVRDYTQSAIDLSKIEAIKLNIDQMITACNFAASQDGASMRTIVKAARNATTDFYGMGYIDLGQFYKAMLAGVKKRKAMAGKGRPVTLMFRDTLDSLQGILAIGLSKIDSAIIANAVGPQVAGACGLSIYFPRNGVIDQSYPKTLFARGTNWVNFVKSFK